MSEHRATKPLNLKSIQIEDHYWTPYIQLVRDTVIPYQWEALNDRVEDAERSQAIENFRIASGQSKGEFHGFIFQDSDVYKWIEAVGYSLISTPNANLEKVADEAIALIASAQQEDGYINTYYTIKEPDKRLTNLTECHELYVIGHLIEGAVAYYNGTGKTALLEVARKAADFVALHFGPEPHQIHGYDGHQEIELALVKLYEVTGEEKYLDLSFYMINERGQTPNFFHEEWPKRGQISHWSGLRESNPPDLAYWQAHKPVREQEIAVGHAVRAVYMYTAMADLAIRKADEELLAACKRLWNNIVNRQMYINGSIGSTHHGEAFTFDYDLPNDTNYSETCASIGLIFFAQRMLQAEINGEYADIMERALYNTVTAGISRDGKHYFYVNPMEAWPQASEGNPGRRHVKTVRQKWYGCACCPPNVARLLSSLGEYIYTTSSDTLYTHLFIGSNAQVELGGNRATLSMKSNLPWQGHVELSLTELEGNGDFSIAFRVPSWSGSFTVQVGDQVLEPKIKDGYAYITRTWKQGDVLSIDFAIQAHRVYAHPEVRANAGRVALQRGPLLYCLEEVDNGAPLSSLSLPADAKIQERPADWNPGLVMLEAEGFRREEHQQATLYSQAAPIRVPATIVAVPYTLWGNRKPGEMLTWIHE